MAVNVAVVVSEVLVHIKLLLAGKIFFSLRGKHYSSRQILPPVSHCNYAAVLYIWVLVKAVLHLGHRDTLLLNLHDRVGTPFKKETAIRENLHQVGSLKAGRIAYIWGADNQTSICILRNLGVIKGCPLKAVLGLPVCNAGGLGASIHLYRPEAHYLVCLLCHIRGKHAA